MTNKQKTQNITIAWCDLFYCKNNQKRSDLDTLSGCQTAKKSLIHVFNKRCFAVGGFATIYIVFNFFAIFQLASWKRPRHTHTNE